MTLIARCLLIATCALLVGQPSFGQDLSDSDVANAIEAALHGKRHGIGLRLNDVQTSVFSSMACTTCGVSGYTIFIYTPEQWIEFQAINARKEMLPFGIADVTPDMRRPALHVLALPSKAEYINGTGLSRASSVHRVVLSSTDRSETVQPLESTNGTVQDNSAFRSVDYTSAGATFAMGDVERLRSQDKNREFFIVVVGDNQNKFFKVKSRMFKELFGGR